MAVNLSLTQRWLAKESARYPQKGRVYADVDVALVAHDKLRPKTDAYTYDDGRVKHLLCVHGLLPITFRGAAYNIPIACWMPLEYPKEPPMAYVVPTGDMLIRRSNNVDASGLCQIEYVRQWVVKPEARHRIGCSLVGLLQAMQDIFSREPPVYSKPRSHPTNGTSSPAQAPARPAPPIPSNIQAPTPSVSPQPPIPPDRPPLPPKVSPNPYLTSSSPPPPPLPSHSRQSSLSIRPTRPAPPAPSSSSTLPPQYVSPANTEPSYSPPQPPQSAGSVISFEPSRPPPPPPPTSLPPSMGGTDQVPLSPSPGLTASLPSPQALPQWAVVPMQASPPARMPVPIRSNPAATTLLVGSTPSTLVVAHPPIPAPVLRPPVPDLMDDDVAIPQMLSSADALSAPPPRPPNPQLVALHNEVLTRLNNAMTRTTQTLAEDTQRLCAIQSDLLAGEPAICDEMARLEAVRDVCHAVSNRTRDWVMEVEALIADAKRRGEPEVDELVCSTAIVYNQLIDLVAEDNAIEDAMYHLHRALNAGRIDLDRFIKTTRELAEEQFMKRALIEKIEQGLPIGSRGRWI